MKYDFSFRIPDSYTPHSWLNYRSIWLSSKSYMFASHINSVFCFRDDFIIFLQTILADVLQFEVTPGPMIGLRCPLAQYKNTHETNKQT